MSADTARATCHEQCGQQQCGQFPGTVTKFTREQSVHDFGYLLSIIGSATCANLREVIELIGLKVASPFDARVRSVNALTEELGHIRFPVRLGADSRKLG
jgi:hypothetical protein